MYSNRNGKFRDSGYDIVPQQDYWEVVVATGVGTSTTSHTGNTSLYTMDATTGAMKLRGTLDRVCSGSSYFRIGWPGQGPGKVARVISWNRVLGLHEIRQVGRQLEPCKNDCKWNWRVWLCLSMCPFVWVSTGIDLSSKCLFKIRDAITHHTTIQKPTNHCSPIHACWPVCFKVYR